MLRKFLILLLLNAFTSSLFASSMIVGLSLGSTTGGDDFDSAPAFTSTLSFLSSKGPVIEGSIGYLTGDAKTAGSSNIKAVPILAAIKYRLPIKSKFNPYFGVKAGFSILNSSYDSPALTYGLATGVLYHLNHDTKLFFDVSKTYIDTKDSSDLFEPLSVSAGIGIAFGDTHKRKGFKNRRNRKNSAKRNRPVRRPAPKGPRELRPY